MVCGGCGDSRGVANCPSQREEGPFLTPRWFIAIVGIPAGSETALPSARRPLSDPSLVCGACGEFTRPRRHVTYRGCMGFRMRAVALTALVLLLVGCVQNEPTVTARPPAADPVFASDEDALAAAVEAYAAYQMSLDMALARKEHRALDEIAVGDALSEAIELVDSYHDKNWTQSGNALVANERLVFADLHPKNGQAQIQMYVCLDVSSIDVVDAAGISVVDPDRPLTNAETVLAIWMEHDNRVFVAKREVRSGGHDC